MGRLACLRCHRGGTRLGFVRQERDKEEGEIPAGQLQQNRRQMLARVRQDSIEGVLEQLVGGRRQR